MLASIRHLLRFVDLDEKFNSHGFTKKVSRAVFRLSFFLHVGRRRIARWHSLSATTLFGGGRKYAFNTSVTDPILSCSDLTSCPIGHRIIVAIRDLDACTNYTSFIRLERRSSSMDKRGRVVSQSNSLTKSIHSPFAIRHGFYCCWRP